MIKIRARRIWRRRTAVVTCLAAGALAAALVPAITESVSAATSSPTPAPVMTPPVPSSVPLATPPAVLPARRAPKPTPSITSEDTAARTASSQTFARSDGSTVSDLFAAPKFTQSGSSWVPVDTTVSTSSSQPGWWQSGANSWQADFGPSSATDPIAVNLAGGNGFSFTPLGATAVTPVQGSTSSQVAYNGLWADTDAIETVTPSGLQESLVLHSAAAPTSYSFQLSGATATMDPTGREAWLNIAGTRVAEVPVPTVTTADGTIQPGAHPAMTITTGSDGSTDLNFTIDSSWLAGLPASVFPVVVDPDAVLSPGSGGNTYSMSSCGSLVYDIQVGVDSSGCIWRAVVHYTYENYLGANPANQALSPDLQLLDETGSTSGSEPVNVYPILTTASSGSIPFSGLLSEGGLAGSGTDPGGGAFANVTLAQSSLDTWLMQNEAGWGFTITGNENSASSTLKVYAPVGSSGNTSIQTSIEAPPPKSQITSIGPGAVLATTNPTLTATTVTSQYGDTVWYDFQVFPKGGGGAVIDSGWQYTNNPTSYSVPLGALQDGASYIAEVLTSTLPGVMVPQPPVQVPFTVKLGLGSGGPSPTDTVGTAPGQSGVPSAGAPSPGTPPASVTVNMVTGNLALAASNHSLQTVSGPLNVGFSYNTQSQNNKGLLAQYFFDSGDHAFSGADPLVGQRDDQSIDFNWNYTSPIGALNTETPFLVSWTGYVNMPSAGNWQFGVAASGGMRVYFNNSSTASVSTWTLGGGTPANPTYGTTINVPAGGWYPIKVQVWEPATSYGNVTAQLWLNNLNVTPNVAYLGLSGDFSNQPTGLPAGWQLSPDSGQLAFTHLVDDGGQLMVFGADGSAIGFTSNGAGGYTPQAGVQDTLAFVSNGVTGTRNYVLATPSDQTYTFDTSGDLIAASSSADHLLHPAALQYSYGASSGQGSALVLTSITDPVSTRSVTLTYTPSSSCSSEPSGTPGGLLCLISYWDSTTTQILYNSSGQLVQVTNPGSEVSQFAYNSAGQLYEIRDPLAYDAVAYGQRTNDATTYTTIGYNSSGQVSTVTSPAPTQGGSQPQRSYTYNSSSRTTTMSIAGFSPASGYAKKVVYDAQNRVIATTDSTGTHTATTMWDNNNNPIVAISPGGTLTGPSSLAANTSGTYTWNLVAAGGQQSLMLTATGTSGSSTTSSTGAAFYNTGPASPLQITAVTVNTSNAASAPGPQISAGNYNGSVTVKNNGSTTVTGIAGQYPGGTVSGPASLAANNTGTYTWTAATVNNGYPAVPVSIAGTYNSNQVNTVGVAYYTTQTTAAALTFSNQTLHSTAATTAPGPTLTSQSTYSGSVTITNNTSSTITGITASFPGGEQTTKIYNSQNLLTDTYGPAPQPCFNPPTAAASPNQPVANPGATAGCGVTVPHASAAYDQGITGPAATYWANPNLAGPVAAYQTGTNDTSGNFVLSDTDLSSLCGITGTSGGWSAQYTGYVTIPTTGAYDFTITTTQNAALYIDGANPNPATGNGAGGNGTPAGQILQLTAGIHTIRVDYISAVASGNGFTVGYSAYSYGQSQDTVAAMPNSMIDPGYALTTQTTDPDGHVTTSSYSNPTLHIGPQYGLATSVTQDPAGLALTTSTSYEDPTVGGYLRKTSSTLPAGNTTTDSYYANTANSPVTACAVTTSTPQGGLLEYQTDPSPGGSGQPLEKQFIYTATGQQAGVREGPANQISTASWECTYYDTRGRIAQQTWPAQNNGTARTITYSYGSGGAGDVSGDPNLTTDDTLTNPLQATVAAASSTDDATGTVTAAVDLLGRMVSYTDVWGQNTTVTYNQAGQTTNANGPGGNITPGYDPNSGQPTTTTVNSTLLATAGYDPTSGAMNTVAYGNGTTATMSDDSYGHQNSLVDTVTTGGAVISTDTVTFSQAGRETSETTSDTTGTLTNNYSYDNAGRLTASSDPGRSQTSTYGYANNVSGDNCVSDGGQNNEGQNTNRTSVTTPAGTTDYCYNSADQLVATVSGGTTNSNYTYNSLGDQTNDASTTYTWDAADRPATATSPASVTTTNTYDALNRLVQSSTSSGSTARYAYAGYSDAPAAILNTSNAILQQLVTLPGGVSIALQASGNVWSYSNLQGDTTATTNQAGTLTSGPVTYGPWGNLNPGQTAPANLTGPNTAGAYGTNGKLTNTSTSTILLGARTFNPTEAHFLSVDPINGGCANAYVYAHGDSINSSDLSGSDQSCSSFYVTTPSGAIMGSVAANSDVLSFSYVATPPAGMADIGTGLVTVSYPAGSSGSSDITQYLNVQPTTDSFNVALPYIPYPKGSGGKGGSQGVSGTLTITVNYAYYGTATNDGFGIESGGNATITATCQL